MTEYMHRLELIGAEYFSIFIEKQIKKIEAILTSEEKVNENDDNVENCIKITVKNRLEKCFKHIENLNCLWKDVLPQILLKRGIGKIMNSFYVEILQMLTKNQEKYFSHLDEPLKDIIDSSMEFCKGVFNETEIVQFISVWSRIEEMIFMLISSSPDVQR